MRRLIRRHPLLCLAFVLCATLALVLMVRFGIALWHWSDPEIRARPVEAWMTPRYVARVYELPPDAIAATLGLEPGSAPRRTLRDIAKDRGLSVAELLAALEALRIEAAQ